MSRKLRAVNSKAVELKHMENQELLENIKPLYEEKLNVSTDSESYAALLLIGCCLFDPVWKRISMPQIKAVPEGWFLSDDQGGEVGFIPGNTPIDYEQIEVTVGSWTNEDWEKLQVIVDKGNILG